jgi:hypothetical protein
MDFPSIWKLLASIGVQIPLGSKPQKYSINKFWCVMAGNCLFLLQKTNDKLINQIWNNNEGLPMKYICLFKPFSEVSC